MYASDVTRRNRNATIAFNLQEQQAAFDTGLTTHILRQGGGSDYQFVNNINQAEAETPNLLLTTVVAIGIKPGNKAVTLKLTELTRINFNGINDVGNIAGLYTDGSGNPVLDDSSIPIPMGGMDFYFFGTNYGANNTIYWNTNNVITFGNNYNLNTVSFNPNTIPAILLGNYDRLCSEIYHITTYSVNNLATITTIVVEFADYYTDTSNFDAGKYQIRFIREVAGQQRQWVEVSIISSPLHPGYSTNITGPTNPAGYNNDASGNRASMIDSNNFTVNATKISPYDITDGTQFLNVVGTTYSATGPTAGTSFIYQATSDGYNWIFINNAYVDI